MAGTLRLYLAGTIRLERDDALVTEERLPGRQGRVAFAMLAAEHHRPLSKDVIADELWGEPPSAWEVALRSVVSKIRTAIADVGLDGDALAHAFGCYQLHLPLDAWVDLEVASDAVHRAETALRDGQHEDAMGWSLAANAIARRGFLPGEDGVWATQRRADLQDVRVRALECRARTLLAREQHEAAARDAERVVALEPFRESAYRLLMRAGRRGQPGSGAPRLRALPRDPLGGARSRTVVRDRGAVPGDPPLGVNETGVGRRC